MGEYAKYNGNEIKIGTCEQMFYLRWEDRGKVQKIPNSLDPARIMGLYFRLPFPDEDAIGPGGYKDYARGLRLYKPGEYGCDDYRDPELAETPGIVQLHHQPSGLLLLNVQCFHGEKLPDCGPNVRAFWNGKGHSYELSSVKTTAEGLFPIIRCRHCRTAWRRDWAELWDYIEKPMQERFIERGYTTIPKAA